MKSLGSTLIQNDLCHYKKEKFGHRDRCAQREDNVKRCRENTTERPETEIGVILSQGMSGLPEA